MPYYVRAYCTGQKIPSIAEVFEYAKTKGVNLSQGETRGSTDLNSPDWSEINVVYRTGKEPLIIECNRDDGTDDCLARVEPQEIIEEIGPPGLSQVKRRIIKHLNATRFIISSQLLGDIGDDGYEANAIFLGFFVDHCGGLIHADGEGFYEKDELILELD